MAIDINYTPFESSPSQEKAEAKAAAGKMATDSQPDPNSKPKSQDQAADNASPKKLDLPDLQLVDEKSPASKASGDEKPGESKPASQKPAAEKPTTENPAKSEPTEAPKNENTTPQNNPAAKNTDSPTQPEESAGNKPSSQAGGAENVPKDLWDGAMNEVDDHPWRLGGDLAMGAGVGLGLTFAVATSPLWGTVALGAAAIAGTAYAGYEVDKNLSSWTNDVKVADKPSDYTPEEDQQAKAGLNQLGGHIADNAAGVLGGIDGAAFAGGVVSGLTSTVVTDASSAPDEDAARALDKTLTDKSNPPNQNNPPQENNPNQPTKPSDNSTPDSGKNTSQPDNKQAQTDNQTTKPDNTKESNDNQAAKPGNSADDKAEPSQAKSGGDAKSPDAPDSAPPKEANTPNKMEQPATEQTEDVSAKALPSEQPLITDSQGPANFILQKAGPGGEPAAQAYEMARNLLGKDVQGIAGSYARGAARTGQWPVDNFNDAATLDKMPEELDSDVLKAMPPEFQAMYNLRQQFPSIPSDLDIVVGGNQSNLTEIAQQIFNATGVLVEFCSP